MEYELTAESFAEILAQMEGTRQSCCKVLVLAGIEKVFAVFTQTSDPSDEIKHDDLLMLLKRANGVDVDKVVYAGHINKSPNRLMLIDSGTSLPRNLYNFEVVDKEKRGFVGEHIRDLLNAIDAPLDLWYSND